MTLGLSSWAYAWAIGIPGREPANPLRACDLVCRAHDLGLGLVQIADNLPIELLSDSELADLAALSASLGITIEIGFRGLKRERLERAVHIARILRAPLIRFLLHGPDCNTSPQTAVALLRWAGPQLREVGTMVAVGNCERFAASDFGYIADQVGPDLAGIGLDIANQLGRGESPASVTAVLAPHTVSLHIKDFTIRRVWNGLGFTVEGAPAGEGMLAVGDLAEKLSSYRRCRTAVLELWTPWCETLDATVALEQEWVLRSLRNLRACGQFT